MLTGQMAPDTGPDVTTALMTGYPVESSTAAPAAPVKEEPQATTGAEANPEQGGTTGGEPAKTETTPEAAKPADGAQGDEQLATADQYKTLSREQAIRELEKRDQRIAGSDYGVLKLQAEHREELAKLSEAKQLMEIGDKGDPKAVLDWMADYLAKAHNIDKSQLIGAQATQGQATVTPVVNLEFDENGNFAGSDKDLVNGVVGQLQAQIASMQQKIDGFERHSPLLGSLAEREAQSSQDAALTAKAQENTALIKSAAKVKHGVDLSDEEALNTALYHLKHPNLDIEDAVFLSNKEKVKGSMLGKTPATGPTIPAGNGAPESQHANPGPGAGRGKQLTAIALDGYPQV